MKIILNINIRRGLVVEVVGARRSRSGRGRRGPWSELGGAARDVVDVVRSQRGWSSAKPLGTWSTWLLDQFGGRRACT